MRINKFIAAGSSLSRRAADEAIAAGRVLVNGQTPSAGYEVQPSDRVTLDNRAITPLVKPLTVILHKPRGYVVSRQGQGSRTIYDLLPPEYQNLNPVGRLDKDSSGLLLLTNDGQLAHELTHPSHQKIKIYEVTLDKPLAPSDKAKIEQGIPIDNYLSRLRLSKIGNWKLEIGNCAWRIAMSQGRNRQIRRTFAALGYTVTTLHRTHFGPYQLSGIKPGEVTKI